MEALSPLGMEAMVQAAASYRDEHQAQRRQWAQKVARARYDAGLSRRAYEAVDPEHRLVAAELERRWEKALSDFGEPALLLSPLRMGKNCLLTPPSGVDRITPMLGETKNQFALIRTALGTAERTKSKFLSVMTRKPATSPFRRFVAPAVCVATLACGAPNTAAAIVTYSDEAAFLAAISNPGTDSFDDLPIGLVGSPIDRIAGVHTYSASVPNDFFPAGSGGDIWLSINTAASTLSFYNFSANVRGVGGFFFGSDISGNFQSGVTINLVATDGSGQETVALNDTTTSTFFGFVTDSGFASITVNAQTSQAWPTVNNLTLGYAPVPEPTALVPASVLLLGATVITIRRRRTSR